MIMKQTLDLIRTLGGRSEAGIVASKDFPPEEC